MSQEDLPQPKPGLFNNMEDYTEEEVRRVQTHNFMPDDAELADQMYALDAISRKMTEKSEADKQHETSSDDTKASSSTMPAPQGPPPGMGPPQPIAGKKVGFLHPAVRGLRTQVAWGFVKVWFTLACLVIGSFSIYWGSLYGRTSHMTGLKQIVVIEDDAITGVNMTIGDAMAEMLNTTYKSYGDWRVLHGQDEIDDFFGAGANITEKLFTEVHHRHYWSAIHVRANATYDQLEFFKGSSDEPSNAVHYMYETGRDPVSMTPYVLETLQALQTTFLGTYYNPMAQELISQLSDDEKLTLINSDSITTPPVFEFSDYRPFSNYVLIAPTQVGLIYLIIMSFFLFNFFAQIHLILLPHIKIQHYIIYRILGSHLSYLILSLFICSVSAIFQVDFTLAFGKGGFVVFWLTTYLTMAAVGGANENMGLVLFAYNPPFLGVWLISFVILNVSPSFSPMALTNHFYRYGYMFPIHHSNEIYKVIFFNLWKGQLGMNYGVLVAWVVINALLLPLVLKHVGTVMANKKRAEAIKAAQDAKEQQEKAAAAQKEV